MLRVQNKNWWGQNENYVVICISIYCIYSSYLTSCTRSKGLDHDNKFEIGIVMIRTSTQNLKVWASQNSAIVCYFLYIAQLFAHLIIFTACLVSVRSLPAVTETEWWILYYWPLTTALPCANPFTHIYLAHYHVTASACCALHQLEGLRSALHNVLGVFPFASLSRLKSNYTTVNSCFPFCNEKSWGSVMIIFSQSSSRGQSNQIE